MSLLYIINNNNTNNNNTNNNTTNNNNNNNNNTNNTNNNNNNKTYISYIHRYLLKQSTKFVILVSKQDVIEHITVALKQYIRVLHVIFVSIVMGISHNMDRHNIDRLRC